MSKENIQIDFYDDKEKMRDFHILSKEEFLASYSYLTEEEYDATVSKVNETSQTRRCIDNAQTR